MVAGFVGLYGDLFCRRHFDPFNAGGNQLPILLMRGSVGVDGVVCSCICLRRDVIAKLDILPVLKLDGKIALGQMVEPVSAGASGVIAGFSRQYVDLLAGFHRNGLPVQQVRSIGSVPAFLHQSDFYAVHQGFAGIPQAVLVGVQPYHAFQQAVHNVGSGVALHISAAEAVYQKLARLAVRHFEGNVHFQSAVRCQSAHSGHRHDHMGHVGKLHHSGIRIHRHLRPAICLCEIRGLIIPSRCIPLTGVGGIVQLETADKFLALDSQLRHDHLPGDLRTPAVLVVGQEVDVHHIHGIAGIVAVVDGKAHFFPDIHDFLVGSFGEAHGPVLADDDTLLGIVAVGGHKIPDLFIIAPDLGRIFKLLLVHNIGFLITGRTNGAGIVNRFKLGHFIRRDRDILQRKEERGGAIVIVLDLRKQLRSAGDGSGLSAAVGGVGATIEGRVQNVLQSRRQGVLNVDGGCRACPFGSGFAL